LGTLSDPPSQRSCELASASPVSLATNQRCMSSSSLLKNLETESFLILAGRCWGGAVELDVIFWPGVGFTLTQGD
jgi:hypothetical protein